MNYFACIVLVFPALVSGNSPIVISDHVQTNYFVKEQKLETAKRKAPKVASLTSMGIRYQQGIKIRQNSQQSGGWIDAIEVSSGRVLWSKLIYEEPIVATEERDVQEVFIVEIKMDKSLTLLLLLDERNRRWSLNLQDLTVKSLD